MGRDYETKVAIPSRVNVPRSPSPRPRRRYASSESRSPSPPPKRYSRRSPSPDRRRERRRSRSPHSPRRRSPIRQRSPPPRARSPPPPRIEQPPKRRAVDDIEKTRNRRLFGAVLNTLSKFQSDLETPKAKAGNARRRELEEKAREKAKRGIPVDENRAAKRRTGPEWRAWEKACVERKHTNMRFQARFLKTTTEPALYYIPWKLTKSNQAQLDKQQSEVEKIIAREIEALAKKHEEQEAQEKGISLPSNRQAEPEQTVPSTSSSSTKAVDRDHSHSPVIEDDDVDVDAINNEDVEMNLDVADDEKHDSSLLLEGNSGVEHKMKGNANGSGQVESERNSLDRDEDLLQDSPTATAPQHTAEQDQVDHDNEMTEEGNKSSAPHTQSPENHAADADADGDDDTDMVE